MNTLEASSHKTPVKVKQKFRISPDDVCAICAAQDGNLLNFKENHSRNDKCENYHDIVFQCFDIYVLNPEYDIRNTKVCQTCITSMREALSFRKVVREAQQRLQEAINLLLGYSSHSIKVEGNDEHESKPIIPYKPANVSLTSEYSISSNYNLLNEIQDNDNIEDTLNDNTEDVFNDSSDGESSTTSEQMRVATGYKKLTSKNIKPDKPCPVCNMTFVTITELESHRKTHIERSICHICGASCANDSTYRQHVLTHEKTRSLPTCSLCGKKFSNKTILGRHIRSIHNKEKLISCFKCKMMFNTVYTKRLHMYHNHPDVPMATFPCTVCDKVCMTAGSLKTHKEVVHDKLLKHACEECNYRSTTKDLLAQHKVVHTGIKKHVCNVCGNAFARRNTLREHLKIHNNIRNYKCDFCEKTFVQNCSLKSHIKTHHKNNVEYVIEVITE